MMHLVPHGFVDGTTALYSVVGAITGIFSWFQWIRPAIKSWRTRREVRRAKETEMHDAIVGRDAIVDNITKKELAPALPGIGVRMANVETALQQLVEVHNILSTQALTLDNHETRIKHLEDERLDRLVTKAESAQMWRALADKDDLTEPDEQ